MYHGDNFVGWFREDDEFDFDNGDFEDEEEDEGDVCSDREDCELGWFFWSLFGATRFREDIIILQIQQNK